jgi:hypothetical protein
MTVNKALSLTFHPGRTLWRDPRRGPCNYLQSIDSVSCLHPGVRARKLTHFTASYISSCGPGHACSGASLQMISANFPFPFNSHSPNIPIPNTNGNSTKFFHPSPTILLLGLEASRNITTPERKYSERLASSRRARRAVDTSTIG